MLVHIDYSSGDPISYQLVAQIKWLVVSGQLKAGEKLPSIREFARQLKVNPTTVTRIYNELEHEGTITLRQGQGAFVSEQAPALSADAVKRIVEDKARAMLVEGLRLGLKKGQIDEIVTEEVKKIRMAKNE
jgi:GntR family transcriptional regulator